LCLEFELVLPSFVGTGSGVLDWIRRGWKQEFDGWEAYKKSKPIIYSDLSSAIMTFSFSDTNVTENRESVKNKIATNARIKNTGGFIRAFVAFF
jgi:phosphoenolpyruvate carboxylase